MTKKEYEHKRAMISASDAETRLKEIALAELEQRFNPTSSTDLAHKQFIESRAEMHTMDTE